MSDYVKVIDLKELSGTEGKAIKVNNHNIALFKLSSGEVFAIENSCPHVGAPLHNGTIEGKELTCLWHSWCFDLETGSSTNCPGVSITKFPTKIEDGSVFLKLN